MVTGNGGLRMTHRCFTSRTSTQNTCTLTPCTVTHTYRVSLLSSNADFPSCPNSNLPSGCTRVTKGGGEWWRWRRGGVQGDSHINDNTPPPPPSQSNTDGGHIIWILPTFSPHPGEPPMTPTARLHFCPGRWGLGRRPALRSCTCNCPGWIPTSITASFSIPSTRIDELFELKVKPSSPPRAAPNGAMQF